MQQKNLLLFLVLVVGLFLGYNYLRVRFFPRPPHDSSPVAETNPENQGQTPPDTKPAEEAKLQPKAQPRPQVKPAKPTRKEPHRDNIPLGDDQRFNLRVRLTSRGAAVQSVILNKFQEADQLGKPVWENEEKKQPKPLELIPDDEANPSNLLYHYGHKEGQEEDNPDTVRPLDTLGSIDWALKSQKNGPDEAEQEVVFTTEVPDQGITLTKTYQLQPGDYHMSLTLQMERTRPGTESFRYQLTSGHGLPIEGIWYTNVYRNALIGRLDASGHIWRDLQYAEKIGFHAGGDQVKKDTKPIQYAGIASQYFASLIVVPEQQDILAWARPTVESEPDPSKRFVDDLTMRVVAEPIKLELHKPVVHKYMLYNGPLKVRLLGQLAGDRAVQPELLEEYESTLHLNTLTDYRSPSTPAFFEKIGWSGLLIRCTNIMHGFLWWLHRLIPNYGLCIILLTILVRGMMYPLSRRQALASARMQAKMQEMAPEVKKLEEKYRNDPMGLQKAKQELYMKRGINPAAMMGSCWMVFLQMPIFLGLYYALQESIHFRLAPFLWIDNLAAPDMLIKWGDQIPWVSRWQDLRASWLYLGPFFNVLPIVAVSIMIVQQKMMTPPPTDEQQAMQQKMMKYMMVFFGFMFYKVAAGLCLYFIASSVWGVTERKLLPKNKTGTEPVIAKPGTPAARAKARALEGNGHGPLQKMRDFWEKVLKEAKKK